MPRFDVAQHSGLHHQHWRLKGHPAAMAAFRRGLASGEEGLSTLAGHAPGGRGLLGLGQHKAPAVTGVVSHHSGSSMR